MGTHWGGLQTSTCSVHFSDHRKHSESLRLASDYATVCLKKERTGLAGPLPHRSVVLRVVSGQFWFNYTECVLSACEIQDCRALHGSAALEGSQGTVTALHTRPITSVTWCDFR
eukprot:m.21974 g.21974  ORF g.21974 m.21974 type:complete len:114 (+) comp10604_c0_seq1:57-398(+)